MPFCCNAQSLPEETRAKIYSDPAVLAPFSFALRVLQAAVAAHTKEAVFMSDLTKLGLRAEYVAELTNAYKQRREHMTDTAQKQRVALPTITSSSRSCARGLSHTEARAHRLTAVRACLLCCRADVRWRVDVTISTTSLSRVFKPTIPLQLTLSDGSMHNFECSVDKFHELRYSVAKSLKHAQDLQQHPTLTRDME